MITNINVFSGGNYGCVIPVAGLSSRMGDFKPLMVLEDHKTMIEHTVTSVLSLNIKKCVLVLGYQGNRIEQVFKNHRYGSRVEFIYNHNYGETDMLYSIKLGLVHLTKTSEIKASYILPGDMPRISEGTFTTVARCLEREKPLVVFPEYEGKIKHPPLISRSCFDHIIQFNQDGGLRKALEKFQEHTKYVKVHDYGCCLDADTKQEFISVKQFQVLS